MYSQSRMSGLGSRHIPAFLSISVVVLACQGPTAPDTGRQQEDDTAAVSGDTAVSSDTSDTAAAVDKILEAYLGCSLDAFEEPAENPLAVSIVITDTNAVRIDGQPEGLSQGFGTQIAETRGGGVMVSAPFGGIDDTLAPTVHLIDSLTLDGSIRRASEFLSWVVDEPETVVITGIAHIDLGESFAIANPVSLDNINLAINPQPDGGSLASQGSTIHIGQVEEMRAGDTTGDGRQELVIGAMQNDFSGAIVFGYDEGVGFSEVQRFDIRPWELAPGTPTSTAWQSNPLVDDIDDDGKQDILVGSTSMRPTGAADLELLGKKSGAVVLFTGRSTPGAWGYGDEQAVLWGTCTSSIDGRRTANHAGLLPGSSPLVSIPGQHVSSHGKSGRGAVFFADLANAHGEMDITVVSPIIVAGASSGDLLAGAVDLGDLDNNGFSDFAVYGPNKGVWVFFGPIEPGLHTTDEAPLHLTPSGLDAGFAFRAEGVDLNHDGTQDLVVNSYLANYGGDKTGSLHVIDGHFLASYAP